MMWSLVVLIGAPLLAGLGSLMVSDRRIVSALQYGQAALLLVAGLQVILLVGSGELLAIGPLYTDGLGAWLDMVLALVGATGTLFAVGYLDEQLARGHLTPRRFCRFFCLFDLFLAAMLIAVNVADIAIMWIAIEGSTLAAALLIAFERNKAALEAGWKFMILGSVGIALALFGTIILYYTSEHVLGVTSDALRWSELHRIAGSLDPIAIKVAFVFVLIGYGTKAGLAPMHSWLPDAHTEAPTPVSAMLSANMLTVAAYAILRFKAVADRTVGAAFTGNLLIGLGLLSVTIAAVLLLVQRDYKRLFAYSSIEHVGLALIGFGIGGTGVFAGAWHLLNHALAKSTAFYGAGWVLLRYEHKMLDRITGLLRQMPLAGSALMIAGVALAGLPPFGLFASEILIIVGAYAAKPGVAYLVLALLALAFATLLFHVFRMVLGEPTEAGRALGFRSRTLLSVAVFLNVAVLGAIGLQVPAELTKLLDAIVQLLDVPMVTP